MIISIPARFSNERLLFFFSWVMWLLAAALMGLLVKCLFFSENVASFQSTSLSPGRKGLEYSIERLATGPLSLKGSHLPPILASLSREMVLLAKNNRPDGNKTQKQLLVGIRGTGQTWSVKEGDVLFLKLDLSENGTLTKVALSESPTEFWVKPRELDSQRALIEVGSLPLLKEEDPHQFMLSLDQSQSHLEDELFVTTLKTARFWGQDLFFQIYGGEAFKPLGSKQKLEIVGPEGPYVVFINPEDYLSWKDGRWQAAPLDQIQPDSALARARVVSNQLQLEVWDKSGFEKVEIKHPLQAVEKAFRAEEKWISSVRLRSSSQVTAVVGKKRLILRTGDWLLKTKSGWRKLSRLGDIESYLNQDLKGQLFIFDAIEQDKGKSFLKGHLFNEMRTSYEMISLPINADKPHHSSKSRGKKSTK